MAELGSIQNVDPRSVWPNEAGDFTPWLAEHADLLGAALGLEIETEQREAAVGAFSLDLLGKEAGSDRVVIVENQLERTDHGHLGQLLAYAAGLDAKIVVWISPEVREEHRDAIHWLNEQTTDAVAFFAVELEVWKIGESLPAPRFNVVAQPSDFQRGITRQTTTAPTPHGEAYQSFFRNMLELLRAKHTGFTNAQPSRVGTGQGKNFYAGMPSGCAVGSWFSGNGEFWVECWLSIGSREQTKVAFDHLYEQRAAIESELDGTLTWERKDNSKGSRITWRRPGSIKDSSDEELDELKRWAVDLLPRFRDAFQPRIAALDLDALAAEAFEYEEDDA